MKKIFLLAVTSLILIFSGLAYSITQPSTAKFYTITASQRTVADGIAILRAQRIAIGSGKIIGNSFLVCTRIADKGNFGSNVEQCQGTYNLPRGKIAVIGSRHNRERYTLIVTGGTGFYQNVGGKLDVFQIGSHPVTERVVFSLVP